MRWWGITVTWSRSSPRTEGSHCHQRRYDSTRKFRVATFVRKRDLVPVLAENVDFAGEDDTSYRLQAGLAVVRNSGRSRVFAQKGLTFPLPSDTKLSLSYEQVERLPSRRQRPWVGADGYEEAKPIWVEANARLRADPIRIRAGALT